MISASMPRWVKVVLMVGAALVLAGGAAACGTQNIDVPKSDSALHQGAVLFSQRCSGCHTLSYAAAHGSAANVRSSLYNNGPNFNTRCERPVTRVLYAIQNGGFSGAIMPQNIVVGQDAINVAQFVAKYAGRQVPSVTGLQLCDTKPIGTIPPPPSNPTAPITNPTATAAAAATTTSTSPSSASASGGKAKKK
jgi:mono/diheme cytochrome c family protein